MNPLSCRFWKFAALERFQIDAHLKDQSEWSMKWLINQWEDDVEIGNSINLKPCLSVQVHLFFIWKWSKWWFSGYQLDFEWIKFTILTQKTSKFCLFIFLVKMQFSKNRFKSWFLDAGIRNDHFCKF